MLTHICETCGKTTPHDRTARVGGKVVCWDCSYTAIGDLFTLRNDPPKVKPVSIESRKVRQLSMFSGLDCLPGQQDLFATDGGG